MGRRLYVGNLSYEAGEDDLRQIFSQVGPLGEVVVVRDRETQKSKGFGFVDMQSEPDARRAIEELHDKEVMGRRLRVTPARPRERR